MRVVEPGMLLSFMYESMYNYVGTLFAVFSSLFCFLPGFVAGFSPNLFLDVSHLDCVVLGKIHNRMTRGGSSSNVREGTPVRRSARQAGHSPSRTFHHRLHRQIRPPPSKFCVCLRKDGIMI